MVTIVGAAAIPTAAPSTDQITYTISIGNGPIDQVVMHAHEPPSAVAQPSSVVVDGAAPAVGTVDQAGAGLTIRLGAGAGSFSGGTLSSGNHTVTFDAAVGSLPTGDQSAQAVLDYAVNGQIRHASSLAVPLSLPDLRLSLPPFSGEDRTLPLGTGQDGDFEVILRNVGGDTSAATLTITLPAGLTLDRSAGVFRDDEYQSGNDFGGSELRCTAVSVSVVTCALGAVAAGTNSLIDIPVRATPSAPVGKTGTFTIAALADNGLDANPSDNTVHGSVVFAGSAHLVVTVAPNPLRVVVGRSRVLTARVRNAGPNPAPDTLGLILLENRHFSITGFTGRQVRTPGPGSGGGLTPVLLAAMHRSARSHAAAPSSTVISNGVPVVLWNVGTIDPGRSVSAKITVTARSLGKDQMLVVAGSAAGEGGCPKSLQAPHCDNLTLVKLQAVRAVAVTLSGGSPRRTGPVLAATGPTVPTAPLLAGGLLTILAGVALLLMARRPLPRRTEAPTASTPGRTT